jgi:hypothetical protein
VSELTGWRCPKCGTHNHRDNALCCNQLCRVGKPEPFGREQRENIVSTMGGARGRLGSVTRKHFDETIARYEATVRDLESQRLLLAKLACEAPQFSNPVVIWGAQELRDRVLADAGVAVLK